MFRSVSSRQANGFMPIRDQGPSDHTTLRIAANFESVS